MTVNVSGVAVSGAAGVALSVRVDVLPAVTLAGTNAALTPDGRSWMLSAIASAVPFASAVVTVYVALPPSGRFCVAGVTPSVKSFFAQLGKVTEETWVSQLNVPFAA